MNLILWIVTGVLAAVFFFSGVYKLITPREKIARIDAGGWVMDFSAAFVKTLAVFEILGGAGLVLPGVTGVATVLVPVAATGLAVVMVGAVIVMIRRREFGHMALNLLYFALLVFVAWGRFGPESFG